MFKHMQKVEEDMKKMEDALMDGDGDAAWEIGVKGAGKKRK